MTPIPVLPYPRPWLIFVLTLDLAGCPAPDLDDDDDTTSTDDDDDDDTERVFATGHSWGGDMAQVVSCFLGERFRATVPVAANRPYWFEDGGGLIVE